MPLDSEVVKNTAAAFCQKLSFREKIGQMVQFYGQNLKFLREKYSDAEWMTRYPFGSFFSGADVIDLVGRRIQDGGGIRNLAPYVKCPLLVAGDLENGAGEFQMPHLQVLGSTHDPALAYEFGKVIAQRARVCGFHWTFGPVVDIVLNWLNPASSLRSLGSDPDEVAEMSAAIIRGMQDNGLCATAKHYPGDGWDFRNQHIGTVADDMSREEWQSTFGKVYRRVIRTGVRSIMVGHIALPWADDSMLPATLSEKISTQLLREELHFEGVLVSDALVMSGFVSFPDARKRLIAAVNAGIDVLLWPDPECFDILERAVEAGDIPERRIEESALRVLEMKAAAGLIPVRESGAEAPGEDDTREHFELVAKTVAEKGTVLLADRNGFLPLTLSRGTRILAVIADDPEALQGVEDLRRYPRVSYLLDELEKRGAEVTVKVNLNCLAIREMEEHAIPCDAVLVLFTQHPRYAFRLSGMPLEMVWMMNYFEKTKVIGISLYSPYLLMENPDTPAAVIHACDDCPASQRAVVRILCGEILPQRRSSVPMPQAGKGVENWEKISYRSLR